MPVFSLKFLSRLTALCLAGLSPLALAAPGCAEVALDGRSLTLAQIEAVARHDCPVSLDAKARQRVERAHALLLAYAKLDRPVYGLNRGVGLNKDQTIFEGGEISPAVRARSEQFNRDLLNSHSAAYGEAVPREVARAALLIRLNTALTGGAGLQPQVVQGYADLLNHGITPVLFGDGSVGEADITVLAPIGLALMGEGEVDYRGRRMAAADALQQAGLTPLRLYGKDGLGVVSANAYGAALASLAARDVARLLAQADAVAALSLEGLGGNLAPLLPVTQAQRPFAGQQAAASHMRELLQGSSLWQPDPQRALQDPLSFRTASQAHGAARDLLGLLQAQLVLQINHADDNPTVVLDAAVPADASAYEKQFYVTEGEVRGAVIPSASFDPSAWALPLQGMTVALSQVAQLSAQRSLRLTESGFTGLARFLSPGGGAIGYGPVQKSVSSLAAGVRSLAQPVMTDVQPQAGNIEDVGSNAPWIAQRLGQQVAGVNRQLALELLLAAQALDLRRAAHPDYQPGQGTAALWRSFRQAVPALTADRRVDQDLARAHAFLAAQRRQSLP
ncbi:HAL/PAL/TAL family ammonia-lyase [Bordetella trematum]|uniref:HAL/PAL/TAL family ammonia-lyase n=1 Tax=Bordetella trematum TaxID=123899 RepID=UPI00155930F8|nr:aromatic amino acid ammonia-lyase [Bordetella trematum]